MLVGVFGCNKMHLRPADVPATAVWVDNTFVDCSVERNLSENRCTVYEDRTGQILTDGFFVLSSSHAAAEKSDLHYVAFGDRGIYLENAGLLVQRVPSARDPSRKTVDSRLRALVIKEGAEPVDCGIHDTVGATGEGANCAIKAFAERVSFYVRYYVQYPNSFGYEGYAGDSDGNLYQLKYYSGHEFGYGDRTGAWREGEHISIVECPKPGGLGKMKDGTLFCLVPAEHPYRTRSDAE